MSLRDIRRTGSLAATLIALLLLAGCSKGDSAPAPAHEDAGQPHPNPAVASSPK